jgi:hypothetical protein
MHKAARLVGLGILGLALAVGVGTSGDAKKDKDKEKVKHAIPAGWKALKLTPDQKKAVYAVQDEFYPKISDARKKLADLEMAERAAMVKILTDDQKAQLIGEEKKDKKPEPPKDKGDK